MSLPPIRPTDGTGGTSSTRYLLVSSNPIGVLSGHDVRVVEYKPVEKGEVDIPGYVKPIIQTVDSPHTGETPSHRGS